MARCRAHYGGMRIDCSEMKRLMVLAAGLLATVALGAQDFREATEEEIATVLSQVEINPSQVGALKADFVQTRHTALLEEDLVTKGNLVISEKGTLTWNVVSPKASTSVVSLDSDKRMQAMSRKNDFSKTVYVSAKEWKILLKPLKRDMKQLFSTIEVWVNRSTGDVRQVLMTDGAGDTTKIEFSNVKR